MKTISSTFLKFLLLLLLGSIHVHSSGQSVNKQAKPEEGNYFITPAGRLIVFEKINKVENDSVYYSKPGNKLRAMTLDSVSMIRIIKDKGYAGEGAIIGAVVGSAALIALVAAGGEKLKYNESDYITNGSIGGVGGLLFGALIGNSMHNYTFDNIDLTLCKDRNEKRDLILKSFNIK